MIINDIDLGPYLADLAGAPLQTNTGGPSGQTIGSALVYGARTILWPTGGMQRPRVETVYVEAPSLLGGAAAGSPAALRTLVRQLQELGDNADMNPAYIQWRSGGGVLATDPDDGWWVVEGVKPDMSTEGAGWAAVEITASFVASASPASLGLRWSGGALVSTYTGTPVPLLAYPVGATGQVPTALSRTGGEGAIPASILASGSTVNPALFVRPGTIAGLFTGGVTIWDTVSTGTYPVPTDGRFVNSTSGAPNWVKVYGTQHDFVGDLVVTNGLLLLLVQTGQANVCTVYAWNTSLSTPAWQLQGTIEYQEDASNSGTLREINLDRVGFQEVRVRAVAGTSAGNYAMLRVKLQAGSRGAYIEFWPLTESNTTQQGLMWRLNAAAKLAYDESGVVDLVTSAGTNLTPSATLGFGATFGQTANGLLIGWLYQNPPSASQPGTFSTTVIGTGDASGPALNSYQLYGFFAVPFGTNGNSADLLQAEAESGTLGTGWSNQVDAAASAGHTAQVASGTASGNADTFGTSRVPPAGAYNGAFSAKVASAAGTTAEITMGIWDATSSAFVSLSSTTYKAAQFATSYRWVLSNWRRVTDGVTNGTTTVTSATAFFQAADVGKAISGGSIPAGATISSVTNSTTIVISAAATASASGVTLTIGASLVLPAGHNIQLRVVTAATLGTTWSIDEGALLPVRSATLGQGDFPGDIWAQWAFEREARWARG